MQSGDIVDIGKKKYIWMQRHEDGYCCTHCVMLDEDGNCSDNQTRCGDGYFLEADETTTKPTSSGIKYDTDKVQYSLVPSYALEAVAKNLTAGLQKYKERDNWKKVPNAEQRYLDALYRHLEAHRRGEIYDADNADPSTTHMSAVAVNALFLLEFLLNPELKQAVIN